MGNVQELDGFHVEDRVRIDQIFMPYDKELVGSTGTIEKIAGANK